MRGVPLRLLAAVLGLIFHSLSAAHGDDARSQLPRPEFRLSFPGETHLVDYSRFGVLKNIGTAQFEYQITDLEGLRRQAGEGVYPNESHLKDEVVLGFLGGEGGAVESWDYVDTEFPENDFAVWVSARDKDGGTRQFYIAEALRSAGLIREAIKAYYAVIVHFHRSIIWSRDGGYYWYPARESISRIRKLCATYPSLGVRLEGAFIVVDRGETDSPADDALQVWPGEFVSATPAKTDPEALRVVAEGGGHKVKVVKLENGHWQLRMNQKPFVVKGVTYTATKRGESPHASSLRPWMTVDDNGNGKNDGMFDSWVDKNHNNTQDAGEDTIGDAKLLADLGVNTIRYYHVQDAEGNYDPGEFDKPLMRNLAQNYGIYFVMGDFLGAYTVGSGAAWGAGTDYRSEIQKNRMKENVRRMVVDHKDEPYVLMWLLGNENQHPYTRTNAKQYPVEYAQFVDEVARMIKELDPNHPVAIGNLQDVGLAALAAYAPNVDIYGANVYSGKYSMGSVIQVVKYYYDRPLLFTEWGSDAYFEGRGLDEAAQSEYIMGNWADIELNMAGNTGEGNTIGGILFEWMDEWWKSTKGDGWGDPYKQNTMKDYSLPFIDGWAHEEWFGIVGQGNGMNSPYQRDLRKAYYDLKSLWNGPES